MVDNVLYIAFPYVAIVVFLIGSIYRYKFGFKYSTLSSQFLETQKLYLASVPFHVGIIVIFLFHLIGFIIPPINISLGGTTLVVFETIGLIFGFLALFGIIMLFIRRLQNERLQMVTNKMDIVIEILLILQILLGVLTAIMYKWGAGWYSADMAPYLWSLFTFNPDASAVAAMPLLVKLHVIGAFLIILLIPFSRLVHFLVAPFHYISRAYQVVRWNWDRKTIRDPNTPWRETIKSPQNN